MDVEASRAIRQAEVGASRKMLQRTEDRFGIKPVWVAGDTAYGSAANLGWLVDEKDIEPHIPVIDKSNRDDGTFSRSDFTYDPERDVYICPAGHLLTTTGRVNYDDTYRYFTSIINCRHCPLKQQCCPKSQQRKIPRSIHEAARDIAREIMTTDAYARTRHDRKKVEMLFAHLKRILRLDRLRLRGPSGAQDEFTLAAIAQNLRRLAKLSAKPPDAKALQVA